MFIELTKQDGTPVLFSPYKIISIEYSDTKCWISLEGGRNFFTKETFKEVMSKLKEVEDTLNYRALRDSTGDTEDYEINR